MSKQKIKNSRKFAKTGLVALGTTMIACFGMLAGCEAKLPYSNASWYQGTKTPDESIKGEIGDFYYDTDDCIIYQKSEDGWVFISCIKGNTGESGSIWFSGEGHPADASIQTVKVGDYYLDTENNKIYLRGATDWTLITTIEDGAKGDPGNPGATWFSGEGNPETAQDLEKAKVGDFYLDTTNNIIYKKGNTEWELITSIEDGAKGDPGDPGKNGTNFISDFGVPGNDLGNEGDTYLNLETKDLFKKSKLGWEKVGSIAAGTDVSPVAISSVEDFMNITSYTEGTCFKLYANVDLRDAEFGGSENLFAERFNGTIDGNGHTIYMPTNNLGGGENFIFGDANGTFKDLVFDYGNVNNKYIMFAHSSKLGINFSNVTASGNIQVSSDNSATNYSPFVGRLYESSSFVNCTNNMNISGVKYGSAFVGGYIRLNGRSAANKDGTEREGGEGFINGVSIKFINCVNNGNLNMTTASMLWGNSTVLPLLKNITVEGCVNNGKIVATQQAALFCGQYNDGGGVLEDHLEGLKEINNTIEPLITGNGECFVNTLEGFELKTDTDNNLLLTVPNWTDYSYKLSLNCLMYGEKGGTYQFTASFTITEDSLKDKSNNHSGTIKTLKRWQFIAYSHCDRLDMSKYKKIELENCVYSQEAVACGVKLYLIYNENSDFGYYCFSTEESNPVNYYLYENMYSYPTYKDIEITAYDSEGKSVGQSIIYQTI